MWLKFCVLVICTVCFAGSVRISPDKRVFSAAAGDNLQINCSSSTAVEWSSTPPSALDHATSQSSVQGTVTGGENIGILTFSNLQESNEGNYVCKDSGSPMANATFQLRVFTVDKQDVTFEYNTEADPEPLLLGCQVQGSNHSFTYRWRKGDVPVSELKTGNQVFVQHTNGSLEIKDPTRDLAGVYTCVAEYEEGGKKHTIETDITYFARPRVLPFEKSKNLVQDERLVVECKVLGYPKPKISWFKEDEPITGEEGSRYKLSWAKTYGGAPIENGKLEIASVEYEDAAPYTCMATHEEKWGSFNSTQVILVRVKDKLAALWPFLGIVLEVVILCSIIFLYERRRNKNAAAQEEKNQAGASPEKTAEGVRHRGSPNNVKT